MKLLKVLGIVDAARIKARAFHKLQTRLFRLTGVQAVSVRGFVKSSKPAPLEYGDDVSVIFSEPPHADLESDVKSIFLEINRRHDTAMSPVFIWQKQPDSGST